MMPERNEKMKDGLGKRRDKEKIKGDELLEWKKKEYAVKYPPATWAGPFGTTTPDPSTIKIDPKIKAPTRAPSTKASTEAQSKGVRRKKAVLCCSGAFERGAVIPALRHDSYDVILLDPNQDGVDFINRRPSYILIEINESGRETQRTTVDGYRALNIITQTDQVIQDISTADMVACFGDSALLDIMNRLITQAILIRDIDRYPNPLMIIGYWKDRCTLLECPKFPPVDKSRLEPAGSTDKYIALKTFIDRMVPRGQSVHTLDIQTEEYFEWSFPSYFRRDEGYFNLTLANSDYTIKMINDRRRYTGDLAFLAASYYAFNHHILYIDDAMKDPVINEHISQVLYQTSEYLISRQQVERQQHRQYVQTLLKRMKTPCKITCHEMGSLPQWNLERGVREPIQTMWYHRLDCSALLAVYEQGLRYQNVPYDRDSQELGHWMRTMPVSVIRQNLHFDVLDYHVEDREQRNHASRIPWDEIIGRVKLDFKEGKLIRGTRVPLRFEDLNRVLTLAEYAVGWESRRTGDVAGSLRKEQLCNEISLAAPAPASTSATRASTTSRSTSADKACRSKHKETPAGTQKPRAANPKPAPPNKTVSRALESKTHKSVDKRLEPDRTKERQTTTNAQTRASGPTPSRSRNRSTEEEREDQEPEEGKRRQQSSTSSSSPSRRRID